MRTCSAVILMCSAGILCSCADDRADHRRGMDDGNSYDQADTNLATSPFGTGSLIKHGDTYPPDYWSPTYRSDPVTRGDRSGVYNDTDGRPRAANDRAVTTSPFGTGQERAEGAAPNTSATSVVDPDRRILSILHAKNQEEIAIGRLAQDKGTTPEVRDYGARLVRDHSSNDTQVMETAREAGVTLMSAEEVKRMMSREKGEPGSSRDLVAQLRDAEGERFDALLAEKMSEGHAELVRLVENAEPSLRDGRVRSLVDRTLPTLRQHRHMAERLEDQPPD